jgi:hypothetical protein
LIIEHLIGAYCAALKKKSITETLFRFNRFAPRFTWFIANMPEGRRRPPPLIQANRRLVLTAPIPNLNRFNPTQEERNKNLAKESNGHTVGDF